MPFHPVIIFGFEKMAGLKYRKDAETLICKLAQTGRAAGINLILCTIMSTIVSVLNSLATVTLKDIYQRVHAVDCRMVRKSDRMNCVRSIGLTAEKVWE